MITFTLVCLSLLIVVAALFLLAVGGVIVGTLRGDRAVGRAVVEVLESVESYLQRRSMVALNQCVLVRSRSAYYRAEERLANAQADLIEGGLDDDDDNDDDDEDDMVSLGHDGEPICARCFTSKKCPTPESCLKPVSEDPAYCTTKLPPSDQYPQADFSPSRLKTSILVRGAADDVLQ